MPAFVPPPQQVSAKLGDRPEKLGFVLQGYQPVFQEWLHHQPDLPVVFQDQVFRGISRVVTSRTNQNVIDIP